MTNLLILIGIAAAAGLVVVILLWLDQPRKRTHEIDSAQLIRELKGGE